MPNTVSSARISNTFDSGPNICIEEVIETILENVESHINILEQHRSTECGTRQEDNRLDFDTPKIEEFSVLITSNNE